MQLLQKRDLRETSLSGIKALSAAGESGSSCDEESSCGHVSGLRTYPLSRAFLSTRVWRNDHALFVYEFHVFPTNTN
ncbi:hypothetical protein CEXT_262801 [Caerostris extrusa]|uniref:Uncharacterized protein n=1 Tax=Caerostris extrusa TaxID=172846 RepID=A0AAV4WDE2_CAEEX|nr:hypothetical protein CEXT_262801 [Caerostris extrusa]